MKLAERAIMAIAGQRCNSDLYRNFGSNSWGLSNIALVFDSDKIIIRNRIIVSIVLFLKIKIKLKRINSFNKAFTIAAILAFEAGVFVIAEIFVAVAAKELLDAHNL
jgi:hypothetical protein